jgi:hypothetical protein
MKRVLFILTFLALSSCYKDYLYVQQEWIDKDFLASSHIGTPDPRSQNPPKGQRLLVAWDFPKSIFRQKLSFFLTVRFYDQTQKVFFLSVKEKRGVESFYFPNLLDEKAKNILTYRLVALNENGTIVAQWKHHFWTTLIDVDQEEEESEKASANAASAQTSSSLVDSKSKQESVTERP